VMADADKYGDRNGVEIAVHSRSDLRQVRNEKRIRNRRANHSTFDGGLRHGHRGASNPPGRPQDRTGRNIGGCSRPRSISDAAQVGSCAAQNAALVFLLLRSQGIGVERLARGALADTGPSTIGFDGQPGAPEVRQPPLFVAAPLAASAVPIKSRDQSEKSAEKSLKLSRRLASNSQRLPPD
jgi:hypothetical protein